MKTILMTIAAAFVLSFGSTNALAQGEKKAPATKKVPAKTVVTPQQVFEPVVDGHLAFMGIPLNISPSDMKAKLIAKGMKEAKDKETETGNIYLNGMVNGVKSEITIVKGQNNSIYNINVYDAKRYLLPQAKKRFSTLLDNIVKTYGQGNYDINEAGFKTYIIKSDKGIVNVQLFNEDEMDGASDLSIISVYYSEQVE